MLYHVKVAAEEPVCHLTDQNSGIALDWLLFVLTSASSEILTEAAEVALLFVGKGCRLGRRAESFQLLLMDCSSEGTLISFAGTHFLVASIFHMTSLRLLFLSTSLFLMGS